MADARKTWAELDTLFADNTAGAISPQDLRDGFTALQPNVSTSAPGVSDDGTDGYDVGHAWLKLDGSGDPVALYRCLANDTGAAVWKQVWPPLVDDLDLSGTDVADLSSGEATDGQVATADGSGGVAWEDAAGGGGAASQSFVVACSDETTDLTTGTAKVTFRMPYAFTVSEVRASVTTAPTGAALTVDINEAGASILSTKLTIDAGEKTSESAATPAVISDASLADDAEVTIDIDQVGSTIAGAGLKVTIIGTPT